MEIEGFRDIINTIYIAKELYDMNRLEMVKTCFNDVLDYENYFEDMYSVISEVFEYFKCSFYEIKNMEMQIFSGPVIVDFYTLAGEYGKRHGISDDSNPVINEAHTKMRGLFDFSYSLDWKLCGHTKSKRPYHSRLAIIMYCDDWIDYGMLAHRLIQAYRWFAEKRTELRTLLSKEEAAE